MAYSSGAWAIARLPKEREARIARDVRILLRGVRSENYASTMLESIA
jgi:hypothetical protein